MPPPLRPTVLDRLHASYDRMPEPWREVAILADLGLLIAGITQPLSPILSIGATCLFAAWTLSRIRHACETSPHPPTSEEDP